MLLMNRANILINLNNKSSRWDLCAGEAVIRALGGSVTDLKGKEIVYDHK